MNTVDELLRNIVDNNINNVFARFASKDKRVLFSLNKQIKSGYFLTERQGALLIRIFNTYIHIFAEENICDLTFFTSPMWSQHFRVIKPIRKIYLNENNDKIFLEFTHDNELKRTVHYLLSRCYGTINHLSVGKVEILNNEKNIVEIFKVLSTARFAIDQRLIEIHEKIKKILEQNTDYLNISSPSNEKLLTKVKAEITEDSEYFDLKLIDRQHRYQYHISTKNTEDSKIFRLANRNSTNVFINKNTHSLTEVFDMLVKLDRLPALVVFNNRDTAQCQSVLDTLKTCLDFYKISPVGIYFRLDNTTESNKKFNNTISEYGYNSNLDSDTSIVGIANGTLPKFLLKSVWRPKTVITFTNGFKNNKSSVYANNVDLKIFYDTSCPFLGEIYELV